MKKILAAIAASAALLAGCSSPGHVVSSTGNPATYTPAAAASPPTPKPAFMVKMLTCGPTARFAVRNIGHKTQWVLIKTYFISANGTVITTNVTDTDPLAPGLREVVTDQGLIVNPATGQADRTAHPARCTATWEAEPGQPPVPQNNNPPTNPIKPVAP